MTISWNINKFSYQEMYQGCGAWWLWLMEECCADEMTWYNTFTIKTKDFIPKRMASPSADNFKSAFGSSNFPSRITGFPWAGINPRTRKKSNSLKHVVISCISILKINLIIINCLISLLIFYLHFFLKPPTMIYITTANTPVFCILSISY